MGHPIMRHDGRQPAVDDPSRCAMPCDTLRCERARPLPPARSSAPSSSGLGHDPLKVETRVRIPLGLPAGFGKRAGHSGLRHDPCRPSLPLVVHLMPLLMARGWHELDTRQLAVRNCRRARRSRGDKPPHTPCGSSCSSASRRHSGRTRHRAHTAFASAMDSPADREEVDPACVLAAQRVALARPAGREAPAGDPRLARL